MTHSPRLKALALSVILGLSAASVAMAQSATSTNVTGRVVDTTGKPIAGAVVQITHVPSGTIKTEVADADGRYSSRGLRVGGPYTVQVEADGYSIDTQDDLQFRLGATETVNLTLSTAETLEAVQVVGTRSATIFDPMRMGASTVVTREQIDTLPTIARSIEDFARTDPRITQVDKDRGGISAAGQNNRFNSITVDGVPTNDEFGLNDNGVPALNNPISLDTIEEFSIGVAGFDVAQGDYTGASINAVTKSGTNEFKGSVYSFYRDGDWFGSLDGQDFTSFKDELTYGVTVGGPIIKDRLFFFVALEKFDKERLAPTVNFNSAGQQIVPTADLTAISTRAAQLGLDVGGFDIASINEKDDKVTVKLDWNISDYHRASLRYSKTDGSILRTPGVGNTTVSFANYWYTDNLTNEALVANVYSDWTDIFSTEVSVSRSSYDSVPEVRQIAPQFQVRSSNGRTVSFGTEQFRQANVLETDTTTAFFAGNLFLGAHEIKGGIDYKKNDVFNLFLESNLGRYFFNSVADFQNSVVNSYTLRVPSQSNDPASAAADFELANLGLFLQDTWLVNTNLTITGGVRIDIPDVSKEPSFNPLFQTTFGVPNNSTNDGNEVVQPRVGFNYTFDTERRTQLRGGVGLFAGSAANVWLANSYTNPGTSITVFQSTSPTTPVTIDVNNLPRPTATQPSQDVDYLDPNFKQPTVWKFNLALEHELPWYGLVGSVEALVTETKSGIFYEHSNLGTPTGVLPDGRLSYYRTLTPFGAAGAGFTSTGGTVNATNRQRFNANSAFNDVLLLRNTGKGNAQNYTFAIEKPMEDNWSAKIAYTYSKGRDANPGTSSRAISNWNSRLVFNPNEELGDESNYIFKDRVIGIFSYKHNFFEGLATNFSVFAEGRSGRKFGYSFLNDANGDRINGNDVLYVPLDRNDVIFRSAAEADAFWAFVERTPALNNARGSVVPRNSEDSPWYTQFDVQISQELPSFFDVKGKIYLNILNFGNLLSDKYGRIEEASFPYRVGVVNFLGVENGRYVYGFPGGTAGPTSFFLRDGNGQSRWSAQVGVRFEF